MTPTLPDFISRAKQLSGYHYKQAHREEVSGSVTATSVCCARRNQRSAWSRMCSRIQSGRGS